MVCTHRTPHAIEEQIERPGWQDRLHLAVILRLKGWMLMRQGMVRRPRRKLRASIHWARQQQAKSWDLPTRRHLLACICDHFMPTDGTLHRKMPPSDLHFANGANAWSFG